MLARGMARDEGGVDEAGDYSLAPCRHSRLAMKDCWLE